MHRHRGWEYKVISLDEFTRRNEELTGRLDGFGAEGREPVATARGGAGLLPGGPEQIAIRWNHLIV